MSTFKNWSAVDVALHNARVCKENRIQTSEWQEYLASAKTGSDIQFSCTCIACDGGPCGFTFWKDTRKKEGVEHESDLHNQILAECRRRGWIALHGSMAHKARRTLGEWDFTVIREVCGLGPSMLLIECKARNEKPSIAQRNLHAHARKLGHTVHICRNFEQFLALL